MTEFAGVVRESCRGVKTGACRFALPTPEGFPARLDALAAALAPAEPETEATHHTTFKISLAGCANGCSRPHIADLGLIASCAMDYDQEKCVQCGFCVKACPDDALSMETGWPELDKSSCLYCGRCARACAEGALTIGATTFRIVVGGKLGRRPRLARELPGRHDPDAALAIVENCLRLFRQDYRPGVRFGDILFSRGAASGLARITP